MCTETSYYLPAPSHFASLCWELPGQGAQQTRLRFLFMHKAGTAQAKPMQMPSTGKAPQLLPPVRATWKAGRRLVWSRG